MMKRIYAVIFIFFVFLSALRAQQFQVDTLQFKGKAENLVNLVIMGDGYTREQQDYFKADAKRFVDYFFQTEPFRQYVNFFNVYAIKTISEESGAGHNSSAQDCPKVEHGHAHLEERFNEFPKRIAVPDANPNTIFGSTFDNLGIHRLVVPQKHDVVKEVLHNHIPNYTQVVILVNSPFYGGSGGEFATATVNFDSNDIAVHEIGHSFAKLADEYWAGNQYAVPGPNRSQSADPNKVPWKHWIGENSIGIYPYGGKDSRGQWFRPHEFCKMQYLVAPFCSVCQEIFVETIHRKVNPILQLKPNNEVNLKIDEADKFAVKVVKTTPNTMRVEWLLNGEKIASDVDSIYLNRGMYIVGDNQLTVRVQDKTNLVRDPKHFFDSWESNWTIHVDAEQELLKPQFKWGDTIETCYQGELALSVSKPQSGVSYKWFKEANSTEVLSEGDNFVVSHVSGATDYYLEASWKGKKSERSAIHIQVYEDLGVPKRVKTTKLKKKGVVTIKVEDPFEEKIKYQWTDENGKILRSKQAGGEDAFLRPLDNNAVLNLNLEDMPRQIFVQKVHSETTCLGEKVEVNLK